MTINWEAQWEMFAENFYDGKAHIQIGEKTLLLKPGAGFGDLSHPTTQLMVEMMRERVVGEEIVDIGSGSGILTLASLLMGAKSALGIEIDSEAIEHAKANAKLNGLKARFTKAMPKNGPKNPIFLMNMILSEQRVVRPERFQGKLWIISGILASQRQVFFSQAKEWEWNIIAEAQKLEWSGFIVH